MLRALPSSTDVDRSFVCVKPARQEMSDIDDRRQEQGDRHAEGTSVLLRIPCLVHHLGDQFLHSDSNRCFGAEYV
jgi:hypothetical protein